MSISSSQLLYGRTVKSVAFGELVIEALDRLSAAEKTAYQIDATDITLLTTSVADFKSALNLPREIAVGKKTATENLKKYYKDLENVLKNELDGLMMNYDDSEFFNKYFNARIIVDKIRHTVIKGNMVNPTGVDLKKVKVKIVGKEKLTGTEVVVFEELTNKDGNFVKSALNPELSYDVEFSLPDYEAKKFSGIELDRGTIDRLDVVLVPVV